jgi:hydroxyquinol 1,2-dioxygenase
VAKVVAKNIDEHRRKTERNDKVVSKETITDEVLGQYRFADKRTAQLIHGLIRHLHAYAAEVRLTHAEWRAGLRFLTEAGAITDHTRNEFSLASDVLGLSSLVDLIASPPGATPGSVLGPFHVHDSVRRDDGTDLQGGQPGRPTLFDCRVVDSAGRPLEAEIDFWQNADNGRYPQQDPAQDYQNLRCKLRTDSGGRFRLRTLLPQPYGIPEDGPVGALMRAAGRRCMRPAHFHVILSAPGHRAVTTEVFFPDDPYLATDAVFGVRPQLVAPVEQVLDEGTAREAGMPSPFLRVAFEFRLVPADSAAA